MQETNLASIVPPLAGAVVGFLLVFVRDIWRDKREANAVHRSVRAEQRENLDALKKWLDDVEKKNFPESLPAQSNIVWRTNLLVLYKAFEQDEINKAHEFVQARHRLRNKAKKVETLPPQEQANLLEKHVREFLDKYRALAN